MFYIFTFFGAMVVDSSIFDSKRVNFSKSIIRVSEVGDRSLLSVELPLLILGHKWISVPTYLLVAGHSMRVLLPWLHVCRLNLASHCVKSEGTVNYIIVK